MSIDAEFAADFAALRADFAPASVLRCIGAKSTWTVPAGYAYDKDYDRYVNSGGVVWTPTTTALPYTDVDILPGYGTLGLDLMAGGIVDTGERTVRVLNTSIATVNAAEFFVLDSIEYVMQQATPIPAGDPLWWIVRLGKR